MVSLLIIVLGHFGFLAHLQDTVAETLNQLDFHTILMDGMLPYLLFAGSINIDVEELKNQFTSIAILSTLSTIASTIIIGWLLFSIAPFFGATIPMTYCFIFGALISPTDPIAVLGILKELKASSVISTKLAGESLFNDGVGIVLFITFYQILSEGASLTLMSVGQLFLLKAIGGIIWGAILGLVMFSMIKSIDDYKLEVLITIAGVTFGYAFAETHFVSGPLAMVVSGIFLGNRDDLFFMSVKSRQYLNAFWEIVDEVLNAVLFLLIGFEIITVDYSINTFFVLMVISLVLMVRLLTVAIPIAIIDRYKKQPSHIIPILTWGGLRGGLAIALALSLPDNQYRNILLSLTYGVVLFSIIVQGSTIHRFFSNR